MQNGSTRQRNEVEPQGTRAWLRVAGDLLLLGWVLGLFAYFYQVRGYLALTREVLGL